YATAVFGLARCLAHAGRKDNAVAALGRIPQTSNLYPNAQKKIASVLIAARPTTSELEKASTTIEALLLEGKEKFHIVRDVLQCAVALLVDNHVRPDKTKVLGHELTEPDVRRGLEDAYRHLARLTDDRAERIALVDLANQVRPKTWI